MTWIRATARSAARAPISQRHAGRRGRQRPAVRHGLHERCSRDDLTRWQSFASLPATTAQIPAVPVPRRLARNQEAAPTVHGAGSYSQRDTKFSSKEYFLVCLDRRSRTRQEDRWRLGWATDPEGQAVFLWQLRSSHLVVLSPRCSACHPTAMRDGVLIYGCAVARVPGDNRPGVFELARHRSQDSYGLTPAELTAIDPLHLGPSRAVPGSSTSIPIQTTRSRRVQHRGLPLRFTSRERVQHVHRRKSTIALTGRSFFGRFNIQDDAIAGRPAIPWTRRRARHAGQEQGLCALATTGCLRRTRSTPCDTASPGSRKTASACRPKAATAFRFIDNYEAADADLRPQDADAQHRRATSIGSKAATVEVRYEPRFTRVGDTYNPNSFVTRSRTPVDWASAVPTRRGPVPGHRVACAGVPAVASKLPGHVCEYVCATCSGSVSQTNGAPTTLVDGTPSPSVKRSLASSAPTSTSSTCRTVEAGA